MALLLIIFRKDARRLWPAALLCGLLLAILTTIDIWRTDYTPSLEESLCNLLLPLAWCGLIAHLVHMESPAAANPFYATRPYPWPALFGAKLLFVLLFIHLPLLLANSLVLSTHGFAFWQHLPPLLSLQLTVAVALTIPSLALAALARTMAQVACGALLLIVAAAGLRWYALPAQFPWIVFDLDSLYAALTCLTLASLVILVLQFARRRTALSRTIGVAAVLAAAAVFVYLPRELTASLRASGASGARLELRPADSAESNPPARFPFGIRTMGIPLKLTGVSTDTQVTTEILSLELLDGRGFNWVFDPRQNFRQRPNPIQAGLWMREDRLGWLSVRMLQPTFEALKDARVSIQGKASITVFDKLEQHSMPAESRARDVPGVGRCSSFLTENAMNPYGGELVKVLCESPGPFPRRVDVLLTSQGAAEPWRQFLGDAGMHTSYPTVAWLSPLHRRQTFFHVVPGAVAFLGSGYQVPKAALPGARLTFQPWRETRRLVVPFRFSNLNLKEGLVQE